MDKYVVRQAIKERQNDEIVGYEIMIQSDNDSLYNNSSESMAADTISSFLTQNTDKIFNEMLTFLTFPPSLLFRNTPKMFDKDRLIIQIEDNIVVHPLAPAIIQKYRTQGYRFAINDFQFTPKYFSMLELMEYVKVTVTNKHDEKSRLSLDNVVNMLHGFNKKCIAVGVNSKEDYNLAKTIGVDYLEGNYIEESQITRTNKADYLEGNFFQLVVSVTKDEPDLDEIEMIISRDATLTYSILKMVNSAYFALRKRTSSIRQAIVTLGIGQLRQWVYLLSMNEEDRGGAAEEVLKRSFLRATFASELVEYVDDFPITRSEAYMMGMFSTMDYLINAPLAEILEEIPIPNAVKEALLFQTGRAGALYQLVLDYEQANWRAIKGQANELGIPTQILAQLYMDCVEEINEIWRGLGNEYDRPNELEEEPKIDV